jgi:phosphatidylserine/phosphatidylglycerophosphate/cardiolipin synthase-like enzyme
MAGAVTTEFVTDRDIYRRVILGMVPEAQSFLWLATADLKDLYVERQGRFIPFLQQVAELLESGVEVRLLHAKEPGPNFRTDFDRFPVLIERLERILCPRVHFKSVIVDGRMAYSGSANLTGAGLGAKSDNRRNFEAGFVTTEPGLVQAIMTQFDQVWMGSRCDACGRKDFCADFKEVGRGGG